jgi:hypothetical protein
MNNEPAFPNAQHRDDLNFKSFTGLSKRELFAAMAMQGRLASMVGTRAIDIIADSLAINSVAWADALLKELSKESR